MKQKVGVPGLTGVPTGEGAGWWHETSNFRKLVPQVVVTIINNMLLMDLSMMLAFPTLVIGALYKSTSPDEDGLELNQEQASWLGSLVYIMQPIGSMVSGLVTEPLGRKRGMMFVNIPPLIGWLMLRFARSVSALYAANAVLGLSIGFMEAPVLTYVGEISEPRLRSFLTAFTGVMAQAGYLLVYLLGATMPWRTAASVCASIPIISFLLMLLVPESPLWLLARGRDAEAAAALRWLRGWVRPEVVHEELAELTSYADHTKRLTHSADGKGPSVLQRLRDLLRAQTLRPLLLVVIFFLVFHSSGMSGVRPYMVHIIEEFQLPIDPLWVTVMTAVLGLLATALLMAVVSRVGKRRLSLVSIAGCATSCAVMGAYAFALISPDTSSISTTIFPLNSTEASFASTTFVTDENSTSSVEFDPRNVSTLPPTSMPAKELPATWLPFAAFICLSFVTYFGVGQIPWMYVAEVFPLRSRGLASGVTAAAAYVLYFSAAKTYLMLEETLTLHGVFWLYTACGVLGFIFLYFYLPETEGKTLEEVEAYFDSKIRKGRKDPKLSAIKSNAENGMANGITDTSRDTSPHNVTSGDTNSGYVNNGFHVTHM